MNNILEDLKLKLNITWEDQDELLNHIINSSKEYLNYIAGRSIDYTMPFNKSILLECCRYDYNNARELFEINFNRELIALQIKNLVTEVNYDIK
ncbi:head-tail connector protein [Clostridium thermobutyricum]|uniref:Phage gp6-like head-tail connector protein n=1 Tax=Clostridium thermobutyricum DSM 4928 TaxID=1121339 RepID=A0A1V4SV87_9CLOT|nr:head-tail connector protein [Clostridium thermobutyricum]OPX47905.1 hypothetical protein CLTHE_14760 [Clostridium thermobutyricum DSM 4928]